MSTPGREDATHRHAYRVRFDEAGPDGRVRTSALLRYAQDIAWIHSERRGFDRSWYERRAAAWLVRAATLELLAPIAMGAELEVTTTVLGWRRVWARRRSEALLGGEPAAIVETEWVYVDARGAPARIPPEFGEAFSGLGEAVRLARVELPNVPSMCARRAFRVRPHELDLNDHVNNATYVDWLEESVLAASGPDGFGEIALARLPRRYRLEYATAAGPGAELRANTWRDEGGWCHRLALIDGPEVLRARLEA